MSETRKEPLTVRALAGVDYLFFGAFACIKVLMHFLTNGNYGYFRDELYYIDCAKHLDWGYVDHPPLSIFLLELTRLLLGDSLFAIRLPVVLCGAAVVVLAGFITRELGGGRFAQALTCLVFLLAPIYIAMSTFFSMNVFDFFFWSLCIFLLARILNTGNARLWLWFGLVAGLGLQNKMSMAFFGVFVVVALALTPERRWFRDKHLWIGGAIAGAIFLPNLLWQAAYGWPTLEFMRNAALYKNAPVSFFDFLVGQLQLMQPFSAVLWIAGIFWTFRTEAGKRYRVFSLTFVLLYLFFAFTNGKVYYLAPAYPLVICPGALCFEHFTLERRRWLRPAFTGLLVAGGAALLPLALPVLQPDTLIRYLQALGLAPPQQERGHTGAMPQHFGDRFGWPEMVAFIAEEFKQLSPEDQAKCAILVENYGQAGAIDFFGPALGLPTAICMHNNHYFWGPGEATGEVVMTYGFSKEEVEQMFEESTELGRFSHPNAMPYETDVPLFLCRRIKVPVADAWHVGRNFI